jgi:hypothetical protein
MEIMGNPVGQKLARCIGSFVWRDEGLRALGVGGEGLMEAVAARAISSCSGSRWEKVNFVVHKTD